MRKFYFIIPFIFAFLTAFTKVYRISSSTEQIYLHLDKQVYISGETIWFKAYILSDLVPNLNCKNLFIDLRDQNGTKIISLKLPVLLGVSVGNISLPVSLPQGFYVIEASIFHQALSTATNYYRVVPVFNPKIKKANPGLHFIPVFPDSLNKDISLKIKDTTTGKTFLIEQQNDSGSKIFSMRGYMYGQKVFDQALGNVLPIHGTIPTKDLPSGLLQVKIFEDSNKLVAQKFSFINNQEYILHADVCFDTLNVQQDTQYAFKITFPDSITGNFSLAITNYQNEVRYSSPSNIFSAFLVPSFQAFPVIDFLDKDSAKNIDKEIDPSKIFGFTNSEDSLPDEQTYISIRGKALNNNKPLRKGNINFLVQTKDSSTSYITVPVNKDGSFTLDNLVFQDTATFYYKSDDQSLNIILEPNQTSFYKPKNFFFENFATTFDDLDTSIFNNPVSTAKAEELYKVYTDSSSKFRTLENVTIVSKKESVTSTVNNKYTSGLFSNTTISKTIDLINDPPASLSGNVFDYLQNRIAGLRITRKNAIQYEITSPRSFSLTGKGIPVKIFLNEMEQDGTESVATIPIEQIALIKYFKPGTIALPGVGISPVLVVYTKKVDDVLPQQSGFIKYFKYPGYTAVKDFSTANQDYSSLSLTNTTIYWQPNIIVEDDRTALINVPKSFAAKKIHIVLQGFTVDGKFVYFEKIIDNIK
jgi:hypothetical protein